MENNNDKLDNVIKYLNFLEKEILEKLSRIEKHLGIEKPAPSISMSDWGKKSSIMAGEQKEEKKSDKPASKVVIFESTSIPNMGGSMAEQKDTSPKLEPVGAPASQPGSSKESMSIESKIGMKYFNWIGVIVLIMGIGFFLKHAFDNEWIGIGSSDNDG